MELNKIIDPTDEFYSVKTQLAKAAGIKIKDELKETIEENNRKGNYSRVYPSKGCEFYDCFFQGIKPINKLLVKYLFTEDIVPMKKKSEIKHEENSIIATDRSQDKKDSHA
jgi:hypothetical protein